MNNPVSDRQAVPAAINLNVLWAGIISGLILFGLLMCLNDYYGVVRIEPLSDIAPYLLWGGFAALILPIVWLPRFHQDLAAFEQQREILAASGSADPAVLMQKQARLLIGYALCDTPGMIGIAYYLISSDLLGGLLLILASIIILFKYKPA